MAGTKKAQEKPQYKELILDNGSKIKIVNPELHNSIFSMYSRLLPLLKANDSITAGELVLNYCYVDGHFGEGIEAFKKAERNSLEYVSFCLLASGAVPIMTGKVTEL